MIREGVCKPEEFLEAYRNIGHNSRFNLHGHSLKGKSLRYRTFNKSLSCAACGAKIEFFAFEREPQNPGCCANAYGYDKEGKEILFTKDHIIPVSRGGSNEADNLQTMCGPCNFEKADTMEENVTDIRLTRRELVIIHNALYKKVKEVHQNDPYRDKLKNIVKTLEKFLGPKFNHVERTLSTEVQNS